MFDEANQFSFSARYVFNPRYERVSFGVRAKQRALLVFEESANAPPSRALVLAYSS